MTAIDNSPTTILAFDVNYKLVAVFHSISEAASMTGISRQSLIKAAYGDIISANKRYWRIVPDDFVIESDDVGELTLFEFDSAVGLNRRIYTDKAMNRHSIMLESEYIAKNQ